MQEERFSLGENGNRMLTVTPFGKSQQESRKESTKRRVYRRYTCSHCFSVVTSSRKGCEKDISLKMVKEFVLIERQEYNQLRYIPTVNDISENMDVTDTVVNAPMLSIQWPFNAVKSKVGVRYHNKVDNLFEFLKTHPSITVVD